MQFAEVRNPGEHDAPAFHTQLTRASSDALGRPAPSCLGDCHPRQQELAPSYPGHQISPSPGHVHSYGRTSRSIMRHLESISGQRNISCLIASPTLEMTS
ncbi:hypothetical protein M404DRAFT_772483 [Pisolithus tinctorius Marx 270]|uniref:Uncharacterized protein n=1 Tax=Pisolithus tinctorius Marx 270 TaxID=870435 RepID=A0A0C3NXG1_PISTI|nr:hypothetical protein M404DRAFT_772483 [Pisolithus tinctorius Marx 270]